jgi:hypothetical protein
LQRLYSLELGKGEEKNRRRKSRKRRSAGYPRTKIRRRCKLESWLWGFWQRVVGVATELVGFSSMGMLAAAGLFTSAAAAPYVVALASGRVLPDRRVLQGKRRDLWCRRALAPADDEEAEMSDMSNVGLDDVFNLIQQVLFLLCLSFSVSSSLAHINVCRSWLSLLLHFFHDLQQPFHKCLVFKASHLIGLFIPILMNPLPYNINPEFMNPKT